MKHRLIKKLLTIVIATTTIMSINSVGVNAEWKNNSDGTSSYYDSQGNLFKGWMKDTNGKYYYLNQEGTMEHDKIINGCQLGSDGAWIKNSVNVNNSADTYNINNTNNGIINNGTSGNISINNYYGTNDNSSQESNNTTQNIDIKLPFVMPSNWIKISNTSYAVNSRSPLIYQVKDTFGIDENSILLGFRESLILKTNYNEIEKEYNKHKATCFEYLDLTQKGVEKFYNIVIFNNNKLYSFVMCGTQENYEIDKQDLEKVLNLYFN